MPTRPEKMLLYIESQMKEADIELCKIPAGAPSYQIMRRLIICSRDLVEVIRCLMPEDPDLVKARTLAAELDFSDSIPPGVETKILPRTMREIPEDDFDPDARDRLRSLLDGAEIFPRPDPDQG